MSGKALAIMEPSQPSFRLSINNVPILQGSRRAVTSDFDAEKEPYTIVSNASHSTREHFNLEDVEDTSFDTSPMSSQTSSSFSSRSSEDTWKFQRKSTSMLKRKIQQSPLKQPESPSRGRGNKEEIALFRLKNSSSTVSIEQSRGNVALQLERQRVVPRSSSSERAQGPSESESLIADTFYPSKNNNKNSISRSSSKSLNSYEKEPYQKDKSTGDSSEYMKVIKAKIQPRSILRHPGSGQSQKKSHRISFASMENIIIEDRDDYEEESDYDFSEPSIGHNVLESIQIYEMSSISYGVPCPSLEHQDNLQKYPQKNSRLPSHNNQNVEQCNIPSNKSNVDNGTVDTQPNIMLSATTPQKPLAEGPSRSQLPSHRSAQSDPPPGASLNGKYRETITPEEDSPTEDYPSTCEAPHQQQRQGKVASQSRLYHSQASPGSQNPSSSLGSSLQLESTSVNEKGMDLEGNKSLYLHSSSELSNSPVLNHSPSNHIGSYSGPRDSPQNTALLNHSELTQDYQGDANDNASLVHSETDNTGRDVIQKTNESCLTNTATHNALRKDTESGRGESKAFEKYEDRIPVKVQQDHQSLPLPTSQETYTNSSEANVPHKSKKASPSIEVIRIIPSTHLTQSLPEDSHALISESEREERLPSMGSEPGPAKIVPTYPHPPEYTHLSSKGHSSNGTPRYESTASGKLPIHSPKVRPAVVPRNSTEIKSETSPPTRQVPNGDSHGASANPPEKEMQTINEVAKKLLSEHNTLSPEPVSTGHPFHKTPKDGAGAMKQPNAVNSKLREGNTSEKKVDVAPWKDSEGRDLSVSLHHNAALELPPNPEVHNVSSEAKKVVRKNLIWVTRRKRKSSSGPDSNSIVKKNIAPMQQVGAGQEHDRANVLNKLFDSFMTHSTSKSSSNHSHHRSNSRIKRKEKKQNNQDNVENVSQRKRYSRLELLGTPLGSSSNHPSLSSRQTNEPERSKHTKMKHYAETKTEERNLLNPTQRGFLDQEKSDSTKCDDKTHIGQKANLSSVPCPSFSHVVQDACSAYNRIPNECDPISIIQEESTSTEHTKLTLTLKSDSDDTEDARKRHKRGIAAASTRSSSSEFGYGPPELHKTGSNALINPHISAQASPIKSNQLQNLVVKPFERDENGNTGAALQTPKEFTEETHDVNASEHAGMSVWIAKPAIHFVHMPTGEVSVTDKPVPLVFSRFDEDPDTTEKSVLTIPRGYLCNKTSRNSPQGALGDSEPLPSMHTEGTMGNKGSLAHAHSHGDLKSFPILQSDGENIHVIQPCNLNQYQVVQNTISDHKGGQLKGKGNSNDNTRSFSLESRPCDRARGKGGDKLHRNGEDQSESEPACQYMKEMDLEKGERLSKASRNPSFRRASGSSHDSDGARARPTSESSLIQEPAVPEVETTSGFVQVTFKGNSDRHHRHHHHHHHRHRRHSGHKYRENGTFKGKGAKKSKSRSPDPYHTRDRKGSLQEIENLLKEDPATTLEYQLRIIMEKKHKKGEKRIKGQKGKKETKKGVKRDFPQSEEVIETRVFNAPPSTWSKTEINTQKGAFYMSPRFAIPGAILDDERMNRNVEPYARFKRSQSLLSQATEMLDDAHQNWSDIRRNSLENERRDLLAHPAKRSMSWEDYKGEASNIRKFRDDCSRPLENNSDFNRRSQDLNLSYCPFRYLERVSDRNRYTKDVRGDLGDSVTLSHSYPNRSTSRDRNHIGEPFVQTPRNSFDGNEPKNDSSFVHQELVDTPPKHRGVSIITPRNQHPEENKGIRGTSERDWSMERYLAPPAVHVVEEYETDRRLPITEYIINDRRAARKFVYDMERVVDGLNLYKNLV